MERLVLPQIPFALKLLLAVLESTHKSPDVHMNLIMPIQPSPLDKRLAAGVAFVLSLVRGMHGFLMIHQAALEPAFGPGVSLPAYFARDGLHSP